MKFFLSGRLRSRHTHPLALRSHRNVNDVRTGTGDPRRRIAYYEAESDHPPANLLADLARALNVTTDELLGSAPVKRQAKASISPRLERRLKQIERLSPKPKQQLLSLIDTFIEAEALKQRRSPQ